MDHIEGHVQTIVWESQAIEGHRGSIGGRYRFVSSVSVWCQFAVSSASATTTAPEKQYLDGVKATRTKETHTHTYHTRTHAHTHAQDPYLGVDWRPWQV